MRRKLSLGAALVAVLALLSVTALAVGLTNYFSEFAQMQDTYGEFEQWPGSARVELVRLMADSGLNVDAERVAAMNAADEQEAVRLADQIIADYYGKDASMITWGVMQRELGEMASWSLEDRALYSDLLLQHGWLAEGAFRNVRPDSRDMQPEEAVRLAREALDERYALGGMLDGTAYSVAFIVWETICGEEPVWMVTFEDPQPSRWAEGIHFYQGYGVLLSRGGEPVGMREEYRLTPPRWDDPFWRTHNSYSGPGFRDASASLVIGTASERLREIVGDAVDGWSCEAYLVNSLWQDDPMWVVFFGGEEDEQRQRKVEWKAILTREGEFVQLVQGQEAFEMVF